MSTTTTTPDRDIDPDPPTEAITLPPPPGWLDRARAWLPTHEAGDYGGVDRVLLGLYVVCQVYASVKLVSLASWARLQHLEALLPAVVIDGCALVLAVVWADRTRGRLIRASAAVLSVALFAVSVCATLLAKRVYQVEVAGWWAQHRDDVALGLAVAPTVLVGVIIMMRLAIGAERRAAAARAAEVAAEQAAADAEREQERLDAERAQAAVDAQRRREQDEQDAQHRRELEALEAQRAVADDEARRRREDEDRQREQAAADEQVRHQRALELEDARRAASEAEAEQRRLDEDRAEQRAAREAKRAERAQAPAAAPARKATARAESGAVRGKRYALQAIVESGVCPKGPRVAEAMGSTDPKAGKRVLAGLTADGLVGEPAQDGTRDVLDAEGCRAALEALGADPAAPHPEGARLAAV